MQCVEKCLRKPGGEQAGTYFQATFLKQFSNLFTKNMPSG